MRFLTLLKQHNVKGRLDFLLAGDSKKFFLLLRRTADPAFKLPCLTFKVGLRYLQPSQYTVHGSLHIVPHGLDARIDIDYRRIVSEEVRSKRLRSISIVLYWLMIEPKF